MKAKVFSSNNLEFRILDSTSVLLRDIKDCGNVINVPSKVLCKNNEKYDIVGIDEELFILKSYSFRANRIYFNEESKIHHVRSSFINKFFKFFELPINIKRITLDEDLQSKGLKIVLREASRFIQIDKYGSIYHTYPYEITKQNIKYHNFAIRETVQIIGSFAYFGNNILSSIRFPASVAVIGHFSFSKCSNLRLITFPKESKLKTIGSNAFSSTSVKSVDFPSSLEELGDSVFADCTKLESITFQPDSKITKVGYNAFKNTSIKTVTLPPYYSFAK